MFPTPRIDISDRLRPRPPTGLVRELARRIRAAARRQGVGHAAMEGLGVRIVDDVEMAELHARYLGDPTPTDVLSFGAGAGAGAGPVPGLGDLVLNWQAIQRQALGADVRGWLGEATVLAVHGLAHLTGHDHRDRAEGRRMHADERRMLRAVRVHDPARPYAPRLLRGRK